MIVNCFEMAYKEKKSVYGKRARTHSAVDMNDH